MKNFLNQKPLSNIQGQLIDNQKEKILSAKQLAERLGCSLSYIKKLRKQGKIHPAINLGRFVRYNFKTVLEALQKRSLL